VLKSLTGIVRGQHVLTGEATAGFTVDWTGRFRGHAAAVVRPRDTAEVAAVLALCTDAGLPVVPQGETPAWSAAACRCTVRSS
jgi:FAD/FMN-containing dehydrogenase